METAGNVKVCKQLEMLKRTFGRTNSVEMKKVLDILLLGLN